MTTQGSHLFDIKFKNSTIRIVALAGFATLLMQGTDNIDDVDDCHFDATLSIKLIFPKLQYALGNMTALENQKFWTHGVLTGNETEKLDPWGRPREVGAILSVYGHKRT